MSNFNQDEINKFSEIASDWWNPDGVVKTLHHLNPIRLSFIQRYCELTHKKIIDIGCGGGILTESLARQKAQVVGIDLSTALIDVAKQHTQQSGLSIDYQCRDVASFLNNHTEQFDVITCMELLEHVPNPAELVQHCADLSKPGGDIFFSTINRTIKSWLQAIIGAEYVLQLLPKGTHHYQQFIRPSELDVWVKDAGLTLTHMTGLHYDPFRKKAYLKPDVSVNYLIHCKKQL